MKKGAAVVHMSRGKAKGDEALARTVTKNHAGVHNAKHLEKKRGGRGHCRDPFDVWSTWQRKNSGGRFSSRLGERKLKQAEVEQKAGKRCAG